MDTLSATFQIAAAGMKAQGTRLRVISENVANAESLPARPSELPYRRKVVLFEEALDRAAGFARVQVKDIRPDPSAFERRYEPGHPAADPDGYVLAPNVNSLVESMDMLEAQRSYRANLGMVKTARDMANATIDVLR